MTIGRRHGKKTAQDNLARALYAEIDFNTCDMDIFLERSPPLSELRQKLEDDCKLVPHITDARHTEIYRAHLNGIHSISDQTLQQCVQFYGLLEKIWVQIEGVNYPSYRTLSLEGRCNAVDVIKRTARTASVCGAALLRDFEKEYASLNLTRFDREKFDLSDDELGVKKKSIGDKLDAKRMGQ
ncbi:hypothetical protein [Roseovarius rhodophyticola]|uniref:Uncharacterized protein n=1 Tax=Roseovarius rhodophyticola TaxID=3080827 RepID=A0ABZ2TK17_9RHOB|nr:hypothetical protein [Roseovarius sp. W115]MDV2928700.1 hypothetical protein [Roseovarius sp. W115]